MCKIPIVNWNFLIEDGNCGYFCHCIILTWMCHCYSNCVSESSFFRFPCCDWIISHDHLHFLNFVFDEKNDTCAFKSMQLKNVSQCHVRYITFNRNKLSRKDRFLMIASQGSVGLKSSSLLHCCSFFFFTFVFQI